VRGNVRLVTRVAALLSQDWFGDVRGEKCWFQPHMLHLLSIKEKKNFHSLTETGRGGGVEGTKEVIKERSLARNLFFSHGKKGSIGVQMLLTRGHHFGLV
jgi:hypothetical protein